MSIGWECLWTAATNMPIFHIHPPTWYMSMESHGGMILTGVKGRTRRKTCRSATLSTTNPTWTDPAVNPCLRGERPATNRLSHGMAVTWCNYMPNNFEIWQNCDTSATSMTRWLPAAKFSTKKKQRTRQRLSDW